MIRLGEFRAIDLGDLWWTKELEMYGIRKDRVEVIWPIVARGKSQ